MITTYLTIESNAKAIFTEKRSKFIAYAFPIRSVEDIKAHLDELKIEYRDARHICWAYMIGEERKNFRINDDGEPSGTAGKPILGQINSKNVTNILIAIVRYFGGIKLGTGGLISAYKEAASLVLQESKIITKVVKKRITFKFDYLSLNDVMKTIKALDVKIVEQSFDMECVMEIEMPIETYEIFINKLNNIDNIKFISDH